MKFNFENTRNSNEIKEEELPYFIDEKDSSKKTQQLLDKQKNIKDKNSIEFKEIEKEIKNLRFKRSQAETYRLLFDKGFSQEDKNFEVENLRKEHLRKIIFEKQFHFDKYNNGIIRDSDFAVEMFLAKRELYGETEELKEKIKHILDSFKNLNHLIYSKLEKLDDYYFESFGKDQYIDKLKSDIEERKKEGYVFIKDKDVIQQENSFVGVKKLEDGRIDYSSSAKIL